MTKPNEPIPQFLTGNEAVARGVYAAGLSFASAYPGTPSTEILENLAGYKDELIAEWAPNEKVALEAAIGASIAGARSFAAMKMVGVNVAADPLFSFAYSGVNGGLVLVSADDPGMHSSQNEQDNRHYAPFAKIPMLEPADSQEAHDMALAAFEISETFDAPVLLRMTTRVCHSKSLVQVAGRQEEKLRPYTKNMGKYSLVPAVSRRLRVSLEERLTRLATYAETSPFNRIEDNGSKIGIISSGVAYQYAREVFGQSASYLKLGFTFPLPKAKIQAFADSVETLYVVEECEPFLENQIKQMGIRCIGREKLPYTGELTPGIVSRALLDRQPAVIDTRDVKDLVAGRPPMFCAGCPHRGFYVELARLQKREKLIVSNDIGCYGLSALEPINAGDMSICMGASASIAHGAQKVMNKFDAGWRLVSTMGDSTFFHTGINSLMNTAYNHSNTITCILDNRITGMTGQQENPGTGSTLQGDAPPQLDIVAVVRALGIKNVRVVNPNETKKVRAALLWAMGLDEPAVIITQWPCVLKKLTAEEARQYEREESGFRVDTEACEGCGECLQVACPAISFSKERKARIDGFACDGCGVCEAVCSNFAIEPLEDEDDE